MSSETPGIYDLALASNWYEPPGETNVIGTLLITIENRGPEPMNSQTVEVTIGTDVFPMTVSRLQPGATQVLTLPVNEPTGTESILINSVLNLSDTQDSKPSNNSLSGRIVLISEPLSEPTVANPGGSGLPEAQ
jgi:hypothetical protein